MGSFGFTGLGGGLDVQSLVAQLMYVERIPIRQIDARINSFQTKIKAYNELNSKLSELLSSLENLSDPEVFASKTTSSSNDSLITATASGSASEGTYLIGIDRLALFDNFVSDAQFATSDEVIGTGSFDLQVGSSSTTITIDSSNDTLEGLRQAINNSGADVNASIIHDGEGYRLTITSRESGSDQAISIANSSLTLSDGSTPLDFSRTHQIASTDELDASLTVNGLDVTSSSNQVDDVIEGVTLNLLSTSTSTLTVTVSNDLDTVKGKIQEFVDSYNSAYQYLNSQFEYSESLGAAGTLSGEFIVREIQLQLGQTISPAIEGLDGTLRTLGSFGIEIQNDGTLSVNSSKLDDALEGSFAEVAGLFVAIGEPTNARVGYLSMTNDTKAGTYQVDITAVPEAASVTAPNALAGTLGVDELLTFTLGSSTSIVNLTSSMTLQDIIDTINQQLDDDGLALTASAAGSTLVIASDEMGEDISFSVVSDTDGAGTGIGTTGLSDSGLSVTGTFTNIASGEVFEASGNGNVLTGSSGDASGLRVRFTGDTTGTYGNVSVTLGYAAQLSRLAGDFTDSLEGPIHNAIEGFESSIDSLRDEIDDIEDRLINREQYLIRQFSQANEALQLMNYLQATLSSQLNQLNALL